ncbi:MAG TPA: hypothetical protein VGD45_29745 [Steroidobacter sp.]|uniref:hypothetical protein n=1 Tax=Steroidobacter sp. TaxID=1978227 RepID=UPI002ED90973
MSTAEKLSVRTPSLETLAQAHTAASVGALTEGTIAELLHEDGVEVAQPPGATLPVVQFRPLDFVLHESLRSFTPPSVVSSAEDGPVAFSDGPPVRVRFESSEHVIIVQGCQLQFPAGPQPAESYLIHLPNGLVLSYGQIVALGGDFFGDPDRPICKAPGPEAQQAQFLANYQSLAQSAAAPAQVTSILDILTTEFNAVRQALSEGKQPSAAYGALGDSLSKKWDAVTGGRYLALAKTNFDHFGVDAWTAYMAGHITAARMAVVARQQTDPAKQTTLLAQAYAANAFADHFLTDLFAGGHRRTPRRRLYEEEPGGSVYIPGEGWFSYQDLASLVARGMHDEENRFGVWATNARVDQWVTYGDKRFRDKANYPNVLMARRACQASMDDVWQAFQQNKVPVSFGVTGYVPNLTVDPNDRRNWSPLFRLNEQTNVVERRNDVTNKADYSWTDDWWVWSTAILMWEAGMITFGYIDPNPGATGEVGSPPRGPSGATGPDLSYLPPYSQWPTDGVGGPTGQLG